jgi:hypothetical protein
MGNTARVLIINIKSVELKLDQSVNEMDSRATKLFDQQQLIN